jgi:hypothetical protein
MVRSASRPAKRMVVDQASDDESDQSDRPLHKRRMIKGSPSDFSASSRDENKQFRQSLRDLTHVSDEDDTVSADVGYGEDYQSGNGDMYDAEGNTSALQDGLQNDGSGSSASNLDSSDDENDDESSSDMFMGNLDRDPMHYDGPPSDGARSESLVSHMECADEDGNGGREGDEDVGNDSDDSERTTESVFEGFSPNPSGTPQQVNHDRDAIESQYQALPHRSQTPASEASIDDFHDAMESQLDPTRASPAPSTTATLGSCSSDSVADEAHRSVHDAAPDEQSLRIDGDYNDLFSTTFGSRDDADDAAKDVPRVTPVDLVNKGEVGLDNDVDQPEVSLTATVIDSMDHSAKLSINAEPRGASPYNRRFVDATNTTTTIVAPSDDAPKPASTNSSELPQPEPALLSLAFRRHRMLQLRVLKLVNEMPWVYKAGFEWPARRYWIAVIPAGKAASERMMPSPNGTMTLKRVLSFSIKDVVWLQGNKYTTLRTIVNAFYSRTLLGLEDQDQKDGEFFLLGGVEKISDLDTNCQAMDVLGDKVVVLVACDKQGEMRGAYKDRELLEGLIPTERQVIDLT